MDEYSRNNPSPRYLKLLEQYKYMHENGERVLNIPAEKTFNGQSLLKQAGRIKNIIDVVGASTILDYGSGKGHQYGQMPIELPDGRKFSGVTDFWGVGQVVCYDPAYELFADLPKGRFDGVISTDVLEHCPIEDIPWIVDELMSFARKFLFVNAACFPALKSLPNGENAHCTVEPPTWWKNLFDQRITRHPGLRYFIVVEYKDGDQFCETLFQGPRD